MNEWLDRIVAIFGGMCATAAGFWFSYGEIAQAVLGVILTGVCVWLSAPTAPRRGLGDILTEVQRERFMAHLRDVYGDEVMTVPNPGADYTGIIGDPFGTPVIWCHETEDHEAHLWPINGPQYAPALCMGHQCDEPRKHVPHEWEIV